MGSQKTQQLNAPALKVAFRLEDKNWLQSLPSCRAAMRRAARAAFAAAAPSRKTAVPCEVTLVLADDAFIRRLNHDFRGKNKPTNVLAFPSEEAGYLGDIILSLDTIVRQAEEQKKTLCDHAAHLTIHGVLHVLGYDHRHAGQARKMEKIEIQLLEKLGITNPYL